MDFGWGFIALPILVIMHDLLGALAPNTPAGGTLSPPGPPLVEMQEEDVGKQGPRRGIRSRPLAAAPCQERRILSLGGLGGLGGWVLRAL